MCAFVSEIYFRNVLIISFHNISGDFENIWRSRDLAVCLVKRLILQGKSRICKIYCYIFVHKWFNLIIFITVTKLFNVYIYSAVNLVRLFEFQVTICILLISLTKNKFWLDYQLGLSFFLILVIHPTIFFNFFYLKNLLHCFGLAWQPI